MSRGAIRYVYLLRSRAKTIPKHVHPLVKQFFALMIREQATYEEVARKAGFYKWTVLRWREGNNPDLVNLEAALNVLGKKLIIVDDNYNVKGGQRKDEMDTIRPCPRSDNDSRRGAG